MYRLFTFLPVSQYLVRYIACKGLKFAKNAQLNQLFERLNLIYTYIYGDSFYSKI